MFYWIGSVLTLLASFLVFKVLVRRDYQRKRKLSWYSVGLEILVFATHANLPYLYLPVPWPDLPPFPENRIVGWIALGIMSLGAVLTLGFMGYLGIKTSIGQGSSAVQQSGPYRWSRNPQIVTYSLVILGFVLLYPSLESTGWAILYGIIAHMMVITEEEFLRDSFGIDYQTYCERVPRYISLFR